MKYLIILLLLSSPAHAMEQWIINSRNADDVYYNYGMTINPGPIQPEPSITNNSYDEPAPRETAAQSIYETPTWQAPAYEEDAPSRQYMAPQPALAPAYKTPAERLRDCAYVHDCGGEFAQ